MNFIAVVVDEIVSVLLSKPLITEVMKPQPPYSRDEVRGVIEDVAHSSAMRLDPGSMSKLWDLITMVFKWQITMSNEIIKITERHLKETVSYAKRTSTVEQAEKVLTLMENFNKVLSVQEQHALRDEILEWLSPFNVRVSLLLRMGLQNNDGSFVAEISDSIAQEMLNNLGENIYAVTQNGKALERCLVPRKTVKTEEVGELKIFADQIVGGKSEKPSKKSLRLSINVKEVDGDEDNVKKKKNNFNEIEVSRDDKGIDDIIKDLSVADCEESSLTDDLLDMIETRQED